MGSLADYSFGSSDAAYSHIASQYVPITRKSCPANVPTNMVQPSIMSETSCEIPPTAERAHSFFVSSGAAAGQTWRVKPVSSGFQAIRRLSASALLLKAGPKYSAQKCPSPPKRTTTALCVWLRQAAGSSRHSTPPFSSSHSLTWRRTKNWRSVASSSFNPAPFAQVLRFSQYLGFTLLFFDHFHGIHGCDGAIVPRKSFHVFKSTNAHEIARNFVYNKK